MTRALPKMYSTIKCSQWIKDGKWKRKLRLTIRLRRVRSTPDHQKLEISKSWNRIIGKMASLLEFWLSANPISFSFFSIRQRDSTDGVPLRWGGRIQSRSAVTSRIRHFVPLLPTGQEQDVDEQWVWIYWWTMSSFDLTNQKSIISGAEFLNCYKMFGSFANFEQNIVSLYFCWT